MSLLDSVLKTEEDPNKVFYVFFNRIPNASVIYPDGSSAVFLGGKYVTDDEAKAGFLLQEIKKGNMYLHIDEAKFEQTAAELDPIAEMKARIIAEYEAKKAADGTADMGTSEQGKLRTVNTGTVGGAAVNSSSGTQGMTLALKTPAPVIPSAPASAE